jgi:hypothetical protein
MATISATSAQLLASLNASKLLLGLAGVLVNIGAKSVVNEYLSPQQEAVLRGPAVRRFIVFCMFFLATRDLLLAAGLTLAFVVTVEGVFSERSRFSLLPPAAAAAPVTPVVGGLAPSLNVARRGATALAAGTAAVQQRVLQQGVLQQRGGGGLPATAFLPPAAAPTAPLRSAPLPAPTVRHRFW